MFHRRIPVASAIAATVLLAAGCGGANKPSSGTSASGAAAGQSSGIAAAYKYSRCMRAHGVTSFQDPHVTSSAGHTSVGIMVNPSITGSPDFKSAQKACGGILPGPGNSNNGPSPAQQAAHLKGLLDFATCMRSHHVPSFPDPNAQGDITPAMLSAAGLNLHAPAVDSAAFACIPASNGVLTKAALNAAINGGP